MVHVHISCSITTYKTCSSAQSILVCCACRLSLLLTISKKQSKDCFLLQVTLPTHFTFPPYSFLPPLLPPLRNPLVSMLALFLGSPLCPEPGQAWELGYTYVTNCPSRALPLSPTLFLLLYMYVLSHPFPSFHFSSSTSTTPPPPFPTPILTLLFHIHHSTTSLPTPHPTPHPHTLTQCPSPPVNEDHTYLNHMPHDFVDRVSR